MAARTARNPGAPGSTAATRTTARPGRAEPRPGRRGPEERRPQVQAEPKPPFAKQHLPKPGLERDLQPRPEYRAPRYRPAGKLMWKTALITGGDSGIGRAVAVLYAKEGCDLAINYLPEEQADAEETQRAVEAEGRRCVLLPGDIAEPKFCRELVERTVRELGHLDILVSNAAYQDRKENLDQITDEEFDRTFKTNVYAYFWLARAALKHMKPGGSIIATSSTAGLTGSRQLLDYSATKGAINLFTKALAQNVLDKGIRVNAVAPGPVWTPLNAADEGMKPEEVAQFGASTEYGRPAQPEEIAPAYVFLASDADSSYITGEIIGETGGRTVPS